MASDGNGDHTSIAEIRAEVQDVAEDIVGYPLSGITRIEHDDESWSVGIEVVERESIPDTQDILGQYELTLDESGNVTGYRRTDRYRRGDMGSDGSMEPGF